MNIKILISTFKNLFVKVLHMVIENLSIPLICLGLSQLKKLDEFTVKRNKIAKRYDEGFKKNKNIITPKVNKNINHAYHLYTILINFKKI